MTELYIAKIFTAICLWLRC